MSSHEEGGAAAATSIPGTGRAVSTHQTNTTINKKLPEIAIAVEEGGFNLSNDDTERLNSLAKALEGDRLFEPKAKPLIRKVPSTLCIPKDFAKYFKPRVISIGPIHHGDPALDGSEPLKLILAAHFVKNIGVEEKKLYNIIKTEIGSLKKCYDPKELERFDDEQLAWMFFLDGCAILQAILQGDGEEQPQSKMNIKNDLLTFVHLDLLLLQNQLPHEVLRLLTSSSSNGYGKNFMESVRRFIENNVITPAEMKEQQKQKRPSPSPQAEMKKQLKQQPSAQEQEEAVHLLDRLRKRLILEKTKEGGKQFGRNWISEFIRSSSNRGRTESRYSQTFRNVKELRAAGIWLKPSPSSCLKDVSFGRVCCKGNLWLPPITVDDSTGPKFMNLIAYEMCPDFENDFTVTSYICFLDSLIDEAEDVKELRDSGILYNGLGSDEEVAKLFNKMNTDLVPSPTIYSDVKWQVQRHCRNIWINYAAQAYYTHFNSPWTILAFVAAIAALLLSALQTYYTIK
ncbi:Lycopene cyclase [Hibiscus syriacus]|uniref:Lycopene cyclase n=1 Tax=Hibiscus syriacus TaxID=106335 RepID=A0A6A3CP85_HIBSY|nr:Lycopene cyclase [Hibiscus syriacus]